MSETIRYEAAYEDEGLYIKEVLQRRLRFSSRLLRKLKVAGGIALNGAPARLKGRVKAGDVLTVDYPEETSYFEPEDIPLDVVYEDEDLLVVNKQPFLVVHPTKNYQTGTLANAISFYMKQKGEAWKLRFANRLDRDTSGLVIVCKNAHAQDFLMHEMEAGRVEKKYLAIVHGLVEADGTVDAPIDKDPDHVARRTVRADGYPSRTHYEVLERIDAAESGPIRGYSLLKLRLETGRTHQIRVHMTYIGHPLLGDELYAQTLGYPDVPERMPRQALHAASLRFVHPRTGEPVFLAAPMPSDMQECLEFLRKGGIMS